MMPYLHEGLVITWCLTPCPSADKLIPRPLSGVTLISGALYQHPKSIVLYNGIIEK